MQEIEHFTCIYHTTLFSVQKEVKFYTLLNNENSQKRELQNITTNHSADIGYKDFMMIYQKCTSEPYSFLTINTTLPADYPLRFRKNLLDPL